MKGTYCPLQATMRVEASLWAEERMGGFAEQ
jgi:hypothetical protein